eukprot:SAG22_NODE_1710_length_3761_cov_2.537957_3_plen_90_part_00
MDSVKLICIQLNICESTLVLSMLLVGLVVVRFFVHKAILRYTKFSSTTSSKFSTVRVHELYQVRPYQYRYKPWKPHPIQVSHRTRARAY